MNRHPINVIAYLGSSSRCGAAWMTLVDGSKPAGLLPQVAHAHDFGRESDDTNTSGEGPG